MTNAPIHPRHKDEAAKAAGYQNWEHAIGNTPATGPERKSILAHAQTLANLEAARADLAEIDRIARHIVDDSRGEKIAAIAAPYRASGPRPVTECPKCEAFKREVSDAVVAVRDTIKAHAQTQICDDAVDYCLSRFIIPASDPVAEALKDVLGELWELPEHGGYSATAFDRALAKFRAFIEGDR